MGRGGGMDSNIRVSNIENYIFWQRTHDSNKAATPNITAIATAEIAIISEIFVVEILIFVVPIDYKLNITKYSLQWMFKMAKYLRHEMLKRIHACECTYMYIHVQQYRVVHHVLESITILLSISQFCCLQLRLLTRS